MAADIVNEGIFYGHIIPIVNLLPGSILCKTVSCIGYIVGYSVSGSVICGYIVAAAGFLCSLLASCGIFMITRFLYRGFGEFKVFGIIKKWIRPIVSGLMLTVILSLAAQARNVGKVEDMGEAKVGVFIAIYAINMAMVYKFKFKNLTRLVASFVIAVFMCNCM